MRRKNKNRRRGATLVEFAVVFLTALLLVLGMIDVALAVLQSNSISQAARAGTRAAMVHGNTNLTSKKVPRTTSTWGPGTVTVKGDATDSEISTAVRPYLGGLDPSKVTITVTWPSGRNAQLDPVTVTVTSTYRPMTTFVFGNLTIDLKSSSTARIAF